MRGEKTNVFISILEFFISFQNSDTTKAEIIEMDHLYPSL